MSNLTVDCHIDDFRSFISIEGFTSSCEGLNSGMRNEPVNGLGYTEAILSFKHDLTENVAYKASI